LKKPSKKELLIALIFCVILFSATIHANQPKPRQYLSPNLTGASTQTQEQKRTLTEQFGLSGGQSQPAVYDERIRDIRQWIKGDLKKGTFEDVVMGIEDETENLNGYIESEDVTFTDDAWNGEIVSKIPQNKSLQYVFKVRNLISENGKVVSINTNIKDITPTSGAATLKPLAQIRVTLRELSDKPWQLQWPTIDLPLFNAIAPFLSYFFMWIVTGIIIGLPAYFTILGLVLFIDRALKPMATKLFKKT